MQLYGIPYSVVSDVSVSVSNGAATADIALNVTDPRPYLNKRVVVGLPDGTRFEGVTHAIDGIGGTSSQITATSLVNLALAGNYKGTSSAHGVQWDSTQYTSATNAYMGVLFGAVSATTGEITREDALRFAERVFRGMQPESLSRFGASIHCQTVGGQSGKLVDVFEWAGQSAQELIGWLLGDVYNVAQRIDGNTLSFVVFDYAQPVRYLQARDVQNCRLGFDLDQTTTAVAVESPDIVSRKTATLAMPATNKYIGLSTLYNSKAGAGTLTDDTMPKNYEFDERLSMLRYNTASNVANALLTLPVDRRTKYDSGHAGEAFRAYGWRKTQAVIDNDLGKAAEGAGVSLLTSTWDRTADMAAIAETYAKSLSQVAVAGTITVDAGLRLGVGDVVKLWCMPHSAVVMSVSYSSQSNSKSVSLGTTTGSYEEYKGRVRLSDVKQVARDMTPPAPQDLVDVAYHGRIMQMPLKAAKEMAYMSKYMGGAAIQGVRILGWNARSGGTQKADKAGVKARQAARKSYTPGAGQSKSLGTNTRTGAAVYYKPKGTK